MRLRQLFFDIFVVIWSCPTHAQEGFEKIKTIVVIYAENRSFDHLYGFFPGANGIANATEGQKTQVDHDGMPLPYLTVFGADGKPNPAFPKCRTARFASMRHQSTAAST
jgi:phospholipase C